MSFVVKDKDLLDEPGGESVGDAYIVGSPATPGGAWETHDYELALCVSTGPTVWSFINPLNGWRARVLDEGLYYVQTSITGTPTAWVVDYQARVPSQLGFVFDGGGMALTTGPKGWLRVPDDCEIKGWELTADQSGSIVLDLWVDSYTNFPPTVADTITAAAKPTLAAAQKAASSTLTGWTTSLAKGVYMRANIDSAATVTYVKLVLLVE